MAYTNTLELISVGAVSEVKTGKKPYKVIELAFKNEGKVEGKKVIDFQNPDLFAKVQTLKVGNVITIVKEKDANGYWQWTSLSLAGTEALSGPETPTTQPANNSVGKTVSRVTGSTYETPEERKVKQRYIVRQSSITSAINFLVAAKTKDFDVDGVLDIASQFEAFVYSTDPVQEIADMPDDIPL